MTHPSWPKVRVEMKIDQLIESLLAPFSFHHNDAVKRAPNHSPCSSSLANLLLQKPLTHKQDPKSVTTQQLIAVWVAIRFVLNVRWLAQLRMVPACSNIAMKVNAWPNTHTRFLKWPYIIKETNLSLYSTGFHIEMKVVVLHATNRTYCIQYPQTRTG